jgi:hypothetical protein
VKKELIYENKFENTDGLSADGYGGWWAEDNKLFVDDLTSDPSGMTIWIREEMPADIFIEYSAEVVPPQKAGNINFFFAAKTKDGGYIPDARFTGAYDQYHAEGEMHILTFTGKNDAMKIPGWSRVRRNPGFNLISEDLSFTTVISTPYKIQIQKLGENIKVWINGNMIHDVDSSNPLGEGCIGFRTWRTKLYFEDIKVYKISEED